MDYLIKKQIINPLFGKEKNVNFAKKHAVLSSFGNLKQIIENEMNKIINEIKERLEIMTDKINKFYDVLLIKNPKKNSKEDNLKPIRKVKKTFTFANLSKIKESLESFDLLK